MDMQSSKRLLASHFSTCSRKRIRVGSEAVRSPSSSAASTDLEFGLSADCVTSTGTSLQDVDMSDDKLPSPPVTNCCPMDIDQEVLGKGESNMVQICYGALCDAYASFNSSKSRKGLGLAQHSARYVQFHIVPHNGCFGLSSGKGTLFAMIDTETCKALQLLYGHEGSRAAAVVERTKLKQTGSKDGPRSIFPLSINIYGRQGDAIEVGDKFSEIDAYLQHPFFLEPGYDYFNPQYFHIGGEMKCMTHLVGSSETEALAKRISNEIERVLDCLEDTDTPLDQQPDGLNTILKSHQRAALAFIRRREDHDACQSVSRNLRHIMGIRTDIPSYFVGGIIADVMGLGKTLTMISAVIASLAQATEYATAESRDSVHPASGSRSRATLVIVTSMQVLDVWEKEVSIHTKPGTLKTCVFHGPDRPQSPEGVVGHDMVLTTYATLAADFKSRKVLQAIEWYRVVLDEAHWIRNKSSMQFRAAESLCAERRWCLTGTPIQNRLEDVLSLLKFLHFHPFSRTSVFNEHIITPLSAETSDRARNLRLLLHATCLRRNEKYLSLPEPLFEKTSVELEEEERREYDKILARCARDIDDLVSTRDKNNKYRILFTAIMKLRRFCNHGTLSTSSSATATPSGAADEIDCSVCGANDEDKMALFRQNEICAECGRSVFGVSQSAKSRSTCDASAITSTATVDVGRPTPGGPRPVLEGISTKLSAVATKLEGLPVGSKSLVFSYWTSTLDLLEGLLRERNTGFLRIDGRVSYNERLKTLDLFSNSPGISVLLMSIGTGAVGLTLTAANYVHLIEPQWNPSVEKQAIARAVRMGQTRQVKVIRYIAVKTVEENILALQEKKSALAKFTLDSGSEGEESQKLADLRYILDSHCGV